MEMNTDFFKTRFKTLQIRWVGYVRGRYVRMIQRLHQSTVLQDIRVFFTVTYGRIIIRRQYTTRDLIMFFILAMMLGAGIKAVAAETVTIGSNALRLECLGTEVHRRGHCDQQKQRSPGAGVYAVIHNI